MKSIITYLVLVIMMFSCAEKQEIHDQVVDRMSQGLMQDSLLEYQEYINQQYQVFAMPLPNNLTFAGEEVPLHDLFVRENLDREILVNTYWHSNTFLFQKRANRWFPIIEKILAKNNMPDDFKYLALVESGLDNVRSQAGAAGFWQFMKATGTGYDLEINNFVDERYNLEKSTEAACSYLKIAYKQFGSWSLAAASYNMGKGGLNNQLTKQEVDTYYELYLNKETSRYVYRILAAKLILSNSENFGFHIRSSELYHPYRTYTVTVDSSISNLPQFAIKNGTNYATLRALNPWIRSFELPNYSNKTYRFKFPSGDFHVEELVEESTEDEEERKDLFEEIKDTINILSPAIDSLLIKDTLQQKTEIK